MLSWKPKKKPKPKKKKEQKEPPPKELRRWLTVNTLCT
jgi:hypothetical protein